MEVSQIALKMPKMLFPKPGTDLYKWSVCACDQYTSQPEYWQQVDQLVGDAPSTLRIVFPEVYLEKEGGDQRIAGIREAMDRYTGDGSLVELETGAMLIDRRTAHVPSRKGLIVALDLEAYDFHKGSGSLIRPTEDTIEDRLPPRVKIRQDAPIESPHIMVLIDDPDQTVIEPLFEKVGAPFYETELMQDGGAIKGWHLTDADLLSAITDKLTALADPSRFADRYNAAGKPVLLYAMGDGNHSFATARKVWEQIRQTLSDQEKEDHPARFALVELINLHDAGLVFEPIHRVLFDVDPAKLMADLKADLEKQGISVSSRDAVDAETTLKAASDDQVFGAGYDGQWQTIALTNAKKQIAVASLQGFLDTWLQRNPSARIDYVHGTSVVEDLSTRSGNIGFFLPVLDKHDLFKSVVHDGALPRKTFSMGEAEEKRFYLECRKISL